jgi:hypothetical protein
MVAAVSSASAQPAQAPGAAPTARPPITPAPVVRPPDPELDLPNTDTTKRVSGLGQEATGGAQCRATCDKAYYLCLASDDGGLCATSWTHCLTACPEHSSNF